MKLIIAGSRSIDNIAIVKCALGAARINLRAVTEIVSGTAKGVDMLGEQIAAKHRIPVTQFPADWDKYGKAAGYRRNEWMANYADILIAVWDGKSKGTQHMINQMKAMDKKVHVYTFKGAK